jgi:hypothetical protein
MADITITLTETSTMGHKTVSITVDPETFNVNSKATEVEIEWEVNVTGAPGWAFADKGIEIKGPQAIFKRTHGHAGDTTHRWKRKARDSQTYKYTIRLEKDDETTLTLDPFIFNN